MPKTKVCSKCKSRKSLNDYPLLRHARGRMVEGNICRACSSYYIPKNVPKHKPNNLPRQEVINIINRHGGILINQLNRRGIHTGTAFWEDKVQDGWLALTKAANLYDPNSKYAFYTFALKYINGALLNAMYHYNQINYVELKNWQRLHDKITYLPLNKPITTDGEETYPEIIDPRTPLDDIYQSERSKEIRAKFDYLNDQEYKIALKLYDLPARDRTKEDWNELARLCKPLCPCIRLVGYTKELDNFIYRFRWKLYSRRRNGYRKKLQKI